MRELKVERIREMTEDDIRTKIRELKEELFHLRFRNTMRQLPNSLLLREKRRDVARLETILTEHRKGIRPLAAPGLVSGTPEAKTSAKAPAEAPAKAEAKKKTPAKRGSAVRKSAAGRGSKSKASGAKSKGQKASKRA